MKKQETGTLPVPEGFEVVAGKGPFTELNGPFFEKIVSKDKVIRAFRVEERHLNSIKIIHGGMLMTFADSALAAAVRHVGGRPSVTIKMNSEFLAPAREGDWVESDVEVVRSTRTVAFVRGKLKVGNKVIFKADAIFHYVRAGR
ncbi:PaaI family thioesterase [Sneathiella litorea]|uniref:Hotdog fold thioesterase n=1 Tax=Sneathiella litorea TaxID=2606216 RepID=A0A6L8W784_9PROT|nr:PaaI family thioesterase [Sneathiella litorea]MZR30559.1 hotdog fold thioesterase [Sneathiella litorea]